MKLNYQLTIFLLLFSLQTFATWSIIIVDKNTGEIGMAGASCTDDVYNIGKIIPGKGAIIVQAESNNDARQIGFEMINAGYSSQAILNVLKRKTYLPWDQQYAVVTLNKSGYARAYTGKNVPANKGVLTSREFSIQGNTLASKVAIKLIYIAIKKAQRQGKSIQEILMIALRAGATAGGDSRCGTQVASSAFIFVSKPNDLPNKPYFNLTVSGETAKKDNAVLLLQNMFDDYYTHHTK